MQNILIEKNGYLKICDYGLSKVLPDDEKLTGYCGTVTTMAPEVMKSEPYDQMADWWSVGIIIFQLLFGDYPLRLKNKGIDTDQYLAGTKAPEDLVFPSEEFGVRYSPEIKDLIMKLLVKNPDQRFGNIADCEEILHHPLFKKFNLEMIANHELRPSIKPYIKEFSKTDYDTPAHKAKLEKAAEGMDGEAVRLCHKRRADFLCFNRFIKTKAKEKK